MSSVLAIVFAAMTSAEAIVTVLNSASSCGPRTFAEARAKLEEDAKAGRRVQQFVCGLTVMEDKAAAQRYLDAARDHIRRLAEEKGNPLAWYLLSMEKNDLKLLERAADGGNVQALNAFGAYLTQEAVSRQQSMSTNAVEGLLKRSFGYFGQAAAMRDPNGFINLGTCYLRGFGCARDPVLAFECFRSAAELGHPEGMDYLSASFEHGEGVARSEELSLYWKMRGRAARGDEAADRWLRERK